MSSWIQTYTGGIFHPLDPRPEELRIADISAALAKTCRYSGHCTKFYSVAEHSVLMAGIAPAHLKFTALMHDASEAYLADIPRPIKPHLPGYYEMEDRLMRVISTRYGFEWPLPPEVKQLDNCMLTDEREQNMAPPPKPWDVYEQVEPVGVKLKFWTPAEASWHFTSAFYAYGGRD